MIGVPALASESIPFEAVKTRTVGGNDAKVTNAWYVPSGNERFGDVLRTAPTTSTLFVNALSSEISRIGFGGVTDSRRTCAAVNAPEVPVENVTTTSHDDAFAGPAAIASVPVMPPVLGSPTF